MAFVKGSDGIARSLKENKDVTYRYADSDVATYLPTNTANVGAANVNSSNLIATGQVVATGNVSGATGDFTSVEGDTITDGTLSINAGAITGATSGAFSTTLTAGSIVTTGGITAGIQTISGPGAINLTTLYTELTTTGADAFSLANGAAGQIKIITLLVEGGTATITPTTFSNGTSITMDAANDSVTMIYGTNGWQVIASQAITINA